MNFQFIFIAVILFVFLLWVYARKEADKHKTSAAEEFAGICAAALDRTARRQANLDKVIGLFADKPELSNTEIRKALRVSSRTAIRYMDDLEHEGKVEQIGKTGHYTTYRLK